MFTIFFYSIILSMALIIISIPNSVHAVLFLILVYCTSSGLLLYYNIEFLAIALILIYVGAIAILFLFVVMMVNINIKSTKDQLIEYSPFIVLFGFIFTYINYISLSNTFNSLYPGKIQKYFQQNIDPITNLQSIGQVLYGYYPIFVLLIGLILLIALMGAVVLTINQKPLPIELKYKQISRNPNIAIYSFIKKNHL